MQDSAIPDRFGPVFPWMNAPFFALASTNSVSNAELAAAIKIPDVSSAANSRHGQQQKRGSLECSPTSRL